MKGAKIEGPRTTPKGLRHGFGVSATVTCVPLNEVQKWLGHADLKTTAIYVGATRAEEDTIGERMWGAHG